MPALPEPFVINVAQEQLDGKPIARLVIGVRPVQVAHRFAACGEMNFRNSSRVARFSLSDFDTLSHFPPPRAPARQPPGYIR